MTPREAAALLAACGQPTALSERGRIGVAVQIECRPEHGYEVSNLFAPDGSLIASTDTAFGNAATAAVVAHYEAIITADHDALLARRKAS